MGKKLHKGIDLNELPRKGTKIDWKNSIGYKCKFVYDDIEGEIEILDYKNYYVTFRYKNKIDTIKSDHLSNCFIGKILGKRTKCFKIKVGVSFKDVKRDLIITDRKNKKDKRGSNRKYYKYKCNKCGYSEGWIVESSLLDGCGCACCSGRTVVEGINDVPTTNPWMVKYFQGGYDEAKQYTSKSSQRIYPVCPDCGRVKNKEVKIYDIYRNGSIGCICSDGISIPEKMIYYLLKSLNINFIFQLTKNNFKWCESYRYDFYLPDLNMIIETHGKQHYEDAKGYMKSLKEEKKNDKNKYELALSNGINEYIILDCRESNLEYIRNSILKSRLSDLYDLSKINWNDVNNLALNNLIKEVCQYYEKHPTITKKELSEIFKLSNATIARYIKNGEYIGWCFNVKERGKIATSDANAKRLSKKVLCVELNEEFENMTKCAKELSERFNLNYSISKISDVCRGKRNTHHGFTFKYI